MDKILRKVYNWKTSFRKHNKSPDDYEHISTLLPSGNTNTKSSEKNFDSGSVDSHNDSGYGTRIGQSSSSPELTDSDHPPHNHHSLHHHHHRHHDPSPYYSQVTQYNPYIYTPNSHSAVVISPSSLV